MKINKRKETEEDSFIYSVQAANIKKPLWVPRQDVELANSGVRNMRSTKAVSQPVHEGGDITESERQPSSYV